MMEVVCTCEASFCCCIMRWDSVSMELVLFLTLCLSLRWCIGDYRAAMECSWPWKTKGLEENPDPVSDARIVRAISTISGIANRVPALEHINKTNFILIQLTECDSRAVRTHALYTGDPEFRSWCGYQIFTGCVSSFISKTFHSSDVVRFVVPFSAHSLQLITASLVQRNDITCYAISFII
jgi:hypothetical protein